MKKANFMKICSSAIYGNSNHGNIDLTLRVQPDPGAYIGGNWGIYLCGWFRASGNRFIETVNGQKTPAGSLSAKERCLEKLPKYLKWLEEWKSLNPPKENIVLCDDCNGVKPDCWCK